MANCEFLFVYDESISADDKGMITAHFSLSADYDHDGWFFPQLTKNQKTIIMNLLKEKKDKTTWEEVDNWYHWDWLPTVNDLWQASEASLTESVDYIYYACSVTTDEGYPHELHDAWTVMYTKNESIPYSVTLAEDGLVTNIKIQFIYSIEDSTKQLILRNDNGDIIPSSEPLSPSIQGVLTLSISNNYLGWVWGSNDTAQLWYNVPPLQQGDIEYYIAWPYTSPLNVYNASYGKIISSKTDSRPCSLIDCIKATTNQSVEPLNDTMESPGKWIGFNYSNYATLMYSDSKGNPYGLSIYEQQKNGTSLFINHILPSTDSNTCKYSLANFLTDVQSAGSVQMQNITGTLIGYYAKIYHNGGYVEEKFLPKNTIIEQQYNPEEFETYKYIIDPIYARVELTGVKSNTSTQIYCNEIPTLSLVIESNLGRDIYHDYFKYTWQEKPAPPLDSNTNADSIKFATTYTYQKAFSDTQPPRLYTALNQKGEFIGDDKHYSRTNYFYRCKISLSKSNGEVFAYSPQVLLIVNDSQLPVLNEGLSAGILVNNNFYYSYGFYVMTEDGWEPLNFDIIQSSSSTT